MNETSENATEPDADAALLTADAAMLSADARSKVGLEPAGGAACPPLLS